MEEEVTQADVNVISSMAALPSIEPSALTSSGKKILYIFAVRLTVLFKRL